MQAQQETLKKGCSNGNQLNATKQSQSTIINKNLSFNFRRNLLSYLNTEETLHKTSKEINKNREPIIQSQKFAHQQDQLDSKTTTNLESKQLAERYLASHFLFNDFYMKSSFATVPDKPNFPEEEEKVLAYWTEIDAFQKQLEMSKGKPEYTFFDGPPFATGLPHYGHIAAGTIKDVVTRYATMKGHYVSRRFGWDCHGLPVEYEIDKTHKITNSQIREEMGVKRYNELCREIVMRYSKEWEVIVGRFGRWIDFKNDYKTMDLGYMESIWWAFKEIYKKGLVYRGTKIMPFSTACNTVLSNFEAGSNFKEVYDPAVMVTFPIVGDPDNTCLIAWTTTPWTLPSNLTVAVNPKEDYVKWRDEATGRTYVSMKVRLEYVTKQGKVKKHTILEEFKGSALVGKSYEPLFPFFESRKADGCFRVIGAPFVTNDAGTGMVHCAPGFGEDDYQACVANGLIQPGNAPVPIDSDGHFTEAVSQYKGTYIKDADKTIIADLKEQGRTFAIGTIKHRYPFCWRSQSPLVYRGFDCWFIKVTDVKPRLLELNKTTKWVPAFVQEKRFHNWLEDARDWCFSRNRFWGNPIPLWISDDGEEVVCVGSVQELKELSGVADITDLHRESVDHILIPSKEGRGMLKRIPEVFDCWFESGSMPFAQKNYPFSTTEEEFAKGFPADFIAEGLDQTRGWFYTLMVISGAIKDCAPFKNLIVNGIVLAEDGSKMSKSKKNYPDPMLVADQFGADAVRLYLCNSPVVRAEPLRFAGEGVKAIVREVFLPWFNAYRFCIQNITRWETRSGQRFVYDPEMRFKVFASKDANFMDRWIVATSQHMIKYVRTEMDNYRLYNVVRHMLVFLENLTNWYVRLNRSRMKGDEGVELEDQRVALNILFDVLLSATQLMSPITPFLAEHIYQNMRNGIDKESSLNMDSVHFTAIPDFAESLIDEDTEAVVSRMQNAIETGRLVRDKAKVSMKYPLAKVTLVDSDKHILDGFVRLERYIREELNCLELCVEDNEDQYLQYSVAPENRAMGQAFGKKFDKNFKKELTKLTNDQIKGFIRDGKIDISGNQVVTEMLKVQKAFLPAVVKNKKIDCATSEAGANVILDVELTPDLMSIGLSREVTNRIQRLRKTSGIQIEDQIEIFYEFAGKANTESTLGLVMNKHIGLIEGATRMPVLPWNQFQKHAQFIGETEFVVPEDEQEQVKLYIYLAAPKFNQDKLETEFGSKNSAEVNFVDDVKTYVLSLSKQSLKERVTKNGGKINFRLNGSDVELTHGTHFFLDVKDQRKFQ